MTAMIALLVTMAANTQAAPCVGFTDVDDTSPFCPNVEWIKNRGVTLGCTSSTLYCPNDPVTRLAMAIFMNRLGNALEPAFVTVSQTNLGPTIATGGVGCLTTPYVVTGYPRVATARAALYHQALASASVATNIVYSVNGGSTWSAFSLFPTFATNVANGYISQSPVAAPIKLPVGVSVIFGVQTLPATVNDAGCSLAVRLDSHTGTGSPFDPAVVSDRAY